MDGQIVDMTFNLETIAHFIPHNLLRSHFLRCHAMRGALRDIPKNPCGEDYMCPHYCVGLVNSDKIVF